jgi:hypothetical protein
MPPEKQIIELTPGTTAAASAHSTTTKDICMYEETG